MADLESLINLFNNRKFEQIISSCTSANYNSSTHPAESRILAAAHFSLGQYDAAYTLLSDLSSIFIGDVDFLSLLGATSRRLQKYSEAKSAFDDALKLQPKNPELLNNYSNLLIDMGNLNQAASILSDLVDTHPDYSDAIQNLKRVNYMISNSTTNPSPQKTLPTKSESSDHSLSSLRNPIELAFSKDESAQSRRDHLGKFTKNDTKFLDSVPDVAVSNLDSESLSFIQKCIQSKDYKQALRLLDSAQLNLSAPSGRL